STNRLLKKSLISAFRAGNSDFLASVCVRTVVCRDAFGASHNVLGLDRGVRAHRGPGGPQARAAAGGPLTRSFAIRTRFHVATTYCPWAWVRSAPRYRVLRKHPVVLVQPKISSMRLRTR